MTCANNHYRHSSCRRRRKSGMFYSYLCAMFLIQHLSNCAACATKVSHTNNIYLSRQEPPVLSLNRRKRALLLFPPPKSLGGVKLCAWVGNYPPWRRNSQVKEAGECPQMAELQWRSPRAAPRQAQCLLHCWQHSWQ